MSKWRPEDVLAALVIIGMMVVMCVGLLTLK
jgi:hypothetical protein